MSTQRPQGPIGHCSAKLRRALAIEDEGSSRTVRVRDVAKQRAASKAVRGNRWSRPADFSVPGAFHTRFVSSDGRTTFHFGVEVVSRTSDGGCQRTTPQVSKRLASGAAAEHNVYIERPGAVMTIDPAAFDRYADREQAVETIETVEGIDAGRAVRSNIAPTPEERQRYWRAVHEHERKPGPDRLTLTPGNASRGSWQRLADTVEMAAEIRAIATDFAKPSSKRKTRTVTLEVLGLDRAGAVKLAETIEAITCGKKGKAPARLSAGRCGRCQYRFTVEVPDELDAVGRLAVMNKFCDDLEGAGFMFVAALHAPDHHNDRRNYHLHVAAHDRPARMIGDRWDFEITEDVAGQHERVRYPYRQNKIADWSRHPDGKARRAHGSDAFSEKRKLFAEICNDELDRLGATRRLGPGTLKSLGSERDPQVPLGTRAAPMEAVGIPTVTGIRYAQGLWSALLREAHEETERRARQRLDLRRRMVAAQEALHAAGSLGAQTLAIRLDREGEVFEAAAAVLDAQEGELAEYDVVLAMARARPEKALETCRNILTAIDNGKASRAEQNAGAAISARSGEAEAFLAQIAAIDHENSLVVMAHRESVMKGRVDFEAIIAVTSTLLDRDVPALLAEPPLARPDHRTTLEALLERIMKDDLPILLREQTGSGYRVPGISRQEMRAVTGPALADTAQVRLAELADLQAKRMRAAALLVARDGLSPLAVAAASQDVGAMRALKYVRAYGEHPVYLRALRAAEAAAKAAAPIRRPPESQPRAAWTAFRDGVAGLLGRPAAAPTTPRSEPIAERPVVERPEAAATPPPEPASTGSPFPSARDVAIADLALQLLDSPDLRVVERDGKLVIDAADAPDWRTSAEVFADEPAVRAAALERHASPWLDVPADRRDRMVAEVARALTLSASRPVRKVEGEWQVDFPDRHLHDLIVQWHRYKALEAALTKADRQWTLREDGGRSLPTSIKGSDTVRAPGLIGGTDIAVSEDRILKRGSGHPGEYSVEEGARFMAGRGIER